MERQREREREIEIEEDKLNEWIARERDRKRDKDE